ncbi:DNA-binding transcriptional regulator Fis [Kaarinaea lacus]
MTTELPTPTIEEAEEKHFEKPLESAGTVQPLSDHIKLVLENYFNDLDGHEPAHLYQLVLQEIERPLLETVMKYTKGNQSKASIVLGLNRGTLRKKLKQYDIR